MSHSISRRVVLSMPLALALAGTALAGTARARPIGPADAVKRLEGIEREFAGRLGVAIVDTGTGQAITHRGDERFAMCSTFKYLAAGFALARVDRGEEKLDRRIPYAASDLLPVSPVTKARLGEGAMPVADLCEAAITRSDNAAANLLLASFGGPAALTAWLRSLGDSVTRLDRIEPDLNEARPGDPRDTTTPNAMAATLGRLVLGDVLSPASRKLLTDWLVANRTGDTRLRAGLPTGWRVGDKTGANGTDVSNDIAIMWPPGQPPLLVAAFLAEARMPMEERATALAEVGRVVAMIAG